MVSFTEVMDDIARGFESIGVFVLILGLVASLVFAALIWRRSRDGRRAYRTLRETFGGVLLLGLEILVAADLIRTVAVAPTLENVGVLGLIVLIRTLLSFSLEIEIEGVAPWRRTTVSGAARVATAISRGSAPRPGSER